MKSLKNVNFQGETKKSLIFGIVRVFNEGKDVTQGIVVTFKNMESFQVGRSGFVIVPSVAGDNGIANIQVPATGQRYAFPNLALRVGPAGSKTYFGDIRIDITKKGAAQKAVAESWSWQVENHWDATLKLYQKGFGTNDGRKFYSSLAIRTAPDEAVLQRGIATDRQAVDLGF